jgi:mono/diheme cytochrome c family protein
MFFCFMATARADSPEPAALAKSLGVSFVDASPSTLVLERDGKRYIVDVAARTVREETETGSQTGADVFAHSCSACHSADGRGNRSLGTPDLTDVAIQRSLSDAALLEIIRNGMDNGRMPAWSGKLTDAQIDAVASYVRTLPGGATVTGGSSSAHQPPEKPKVYEAGDDVLFSLPTGRALDAHGVYVNFSHRFPYDPAFSGTQRGAGLFGLDGFALPSFGLRYGVTDRLSVSVWRSPSIIGRPIQLMAAYNFLDEHRGDLFNLAVRVSVEGQDNFGKNYTENIEGIFSRSITPHAQLYVVPTASFNDRRLTQAGFPGPVPDTPGINTFSLGVGLAVDIRPTVALVAEVIPTLVNGPELDIHRPAYSFGIQKKIWRHAFTLGLTNSPGTTVSQRAATRASFLNQPNADTPSGMFLGFDLTRQIH